MSVTELAASLLATAQADQSAAERAQAQRLARMMDDPQGKRFTMQMSDQAFRSQHPARVANQLAYLLEQMGVPKYFSAWEQFLFTAGVHTAQFLPAAVIPAIVAQLRAETSAVILPSEEHNLRRYLKTRYADGTRLNLNQLGEAILGEEEAARRLQAYLDLLARPDVEYISVKISSVFSQIHLVAFEHTVEQICERLRVLYRQAMRHTFTRPDGSTTAKFVNLDMEEYRDLHLTVAAFMRVLAEAEFLSYRAGIVLQAYLPDSFPVQRDLTEWAIARHARGGSSIKIRIVKGANLAMEKVEAELHGWEQAPYHSKAEVDANFKRMVAYACRPEHAPSVNLGVASHNLFDIAHALKLRTAQKVTPYVEFEMLEGMANHQARAVQAAAGGLLLYAPVVAKHDFRSAIAYLVRRLDENTAPENFLHDLFALKPGNAQWQAQASRYLQAVADQDRVGQGAQRTQNRLNETCEPQTAGFANTADTDFSLPSSQKWANQTLQAWQNTPIAPIPLQIGGNFLQPNLNGEGHDPSRVGEVAYRYALADAAGVEQALQVAEEALLAWAHQPLAQRKAILLACGAELARRRGQLLGAMVLDGGKAVLEADPEISEAIDFANYYARAFDNPADYAGYTPEPLGVVVVTPPWNFPLAIPAGGVLAALMAGNSVILKPAPEAVLVGWELAQALWAAGVPQDVLQFVPCPDNEIGRGLVTDARVGAVILTGGYSTAKLFQQWKPDLHLLAETSGKNSLIITALADHDLAIKDLVKSAFGHNGQKCSAASLAILQAEVYDNPDFLRQLRDAAASLVVGSQWVAQHMVTPLIREPGADLVRALTTLESGESWLLQPQHLGGNLWTPGIKLGVQPGSWFHQTECFGPVLGLMRADSLAQAVQFANAVEYGLTSGLHSLDEREKAYWREHIEAGNLYINRGTTGAIVQRQPFGGWKKSVVGSAAKAGGPNYVFSLVRWLAVAGTQNIPDWRPSPSDPSQLQAEKNILRYRPLPGLLIRLQTGDDLADWQAVLNACRAVKAHPQLSVSPDLAGKIPPCEFDLWVQDDSALQARLAGGGFSRLRLLSAPSTSLRQVCNTANITLITHRPLKNPRLELPYYLREQALCETMHRYGNLL
jgi:RHH-type proline utilization regulon transcriptional repressor/proline dehydrogenase/delta 1-pyrroline-5-carboxylate dehydrogenase